MDVFVAKATGGPLLDTDFVKVGKTPIQFELAPGSYQLEVEGVELSHQSLMFEMRDTPRKLLVRAGKEGMATTGTLLSAVGVTAILAASVILVSGSKAPSKLDKTAVLVPMYASGAVLLGAGIGLYLGGQTRLEEQKPAAPGKTAWLTFSGGF